MHVIIVINLGILLVRVTVISQIYLGKALHIEIFHQIGQHLFEPPLVPVINIMTIHDLTRTGFARTHVPTNPQNFPARNNIYRSRFPPPPPPPPPLSVLQGKEHINSVNTDDLIHKYKFARRPRPPDNNEHVSPQIPQTNMHILNDHQDDLTIFGQVNEVPVKILIDTGAGMTVINSQFWDKLNGQQQLPLQPGKYVTANTANGQSISIRGSQTLQFQLGDTIATSQARVFIPYYARIT